MSEVEKGDKSDRPESKDLWFIIKSNLAVKLFFFAYCVVFHMPFHDAHNEGYNFEGRYNPKGIGWASRLSFLLNWDGLYFFNAAQTGYTNLKQYAFYPGFPYVLKRFYGFLFKLLPFTDKLVDTIGGEAIALMVVGLLLNLSLHILNNWLLFRLSRLRGCSLREAKLIGLVFAISGTSLYHVTLYSESLYLTLTLVPLYLIEKMYQEKWTMTTVPWSQFVVFSSVLACSGFVRSVGILSYAYLGYPLLIELISLAKRTPAEAPQKSKMIFVCVVRAVVSLVLFIFPTIWLFLRSREQFCNDRLAVDPDFVKPGFCQSNLGFFYGYIQEKYWNVRFMGQLRDGNVAVYLLSLNFLPILAHFFRGFFQRSELRDLLTLNFRLAASGVPLTDRRIRDFPEFCILIITCRMFYFYANQNSIERFWAAYYFSYFMIKDFHLACSAKKAENSGLLDRVFKHLVPANLFVRLLITPLLFVTNVHPV